MEWSAHGLLGRGGEVPEVENAHSSRSLVFARRVILLSLEGYLGGQAVLAPQLCRALGRERRWAVAAAHGHREYRSEGGAVTGQACLSEVCAACFSSSFKWPQGPLSPNWAQRLPWCPSLPRGRGVIRTPGNRGRLAQVRVKETMELVTMTGSAFQRGYK